MRRVHRAGGTAAVRGARGAGAGRGLLAHTREDGEETMRMQLPESRRARERRAGGALASVALHVALIALAAAATTRRVPAADATAAAPPLVYRADLRPAPPAPTGAPAPPASPASPPTGARTATPIAPPIVVPTGLPVAVPRVLANGPATLAGPAAPVFAGGPGAALGSGAPVGLPGPGEALAAHLVDRAAAVRRAPEPRYPAPLRDRAVEGAVTVRFVVDSTGRVAPGSLRVLDAAHVLFADAVRDALARARYAPAELRGRPVAQLVEQRFEFRLRR
jgi:protein TonB